MDKIEEGLPEDLMDDLLPKEDIYYFSYISVKGGCASSSSRQDYWIAISNKRVLYNTRVLESGRSVIKEGVLPLDKVSFVEVTEITEKSGCSSNRTIALKMGTSGGEVLIPLPGNDKGKEIRRKHTQIVDFLESNKEKPESIKKKTTIKKSHKK